MTDFQKETLKTELESYANIINDSYLEASKELEDFIDREVSSVNITEDELKFQDLLMRKTRCAVRLRSFCRAMKIVENNLNLGLNIPENL